MTEVEFGYGRNSKEQTLTPPPQEVISKLREREWDRENGTEMSKGVLALGPPVLVSSVLGT